ncbi:MAG: uracil-DNA glycosylase [Clostridia bacterium]|nr:uracil-DNA glycosylase [Clostridia bacterium]
MLSLKQLNQEMETFFASIFAGEDKPLVFGEGHAARPQLMLVGEAPGEQEVLQRRPFVGKAGKNLDEFLELAGLDRSVIYVSNVVKIRPTEKGPTGRTRNRAPNQEELALFTPFLMRESAMVQPGIIVTLGNVPLQAYLGKHQTVGQCHGKVHLTQEGMRIFSLYHPASMIYRPQLRETYAEDIMALKELLD